MVCFRAQQAGGWAGSGGGSEAAAAWLACGIDLPSLASSSINERTRALRRIERAMERERWKGSGAYDLDRHLALKRCRDSLADAIAAPKVCQRRRLKAPS